MGIGHWALGIGHWALGIVISQLPITNYPLPITKSWGVLVGGSWKRGNRNRQGRDRGASV